MKSHDYTHLDVGCDFFFFFSFLFLSWSAIKSILLTSLCLASPAQGLSAVTDVMKLSGWRIQPIMFGGSDFCPQHEDLKSRIQTRYGWNNLMFCWGWGWGVGRGGSGSCHSKTCLLMLVCMSLNDVHWKTYWENEKWDHSQCELHQQMTHTNCDIFVYCDCFMYQCFQSE